MGTVRSGAQASSWDDGARRKQVLDLLDVEVTVIEQARKTRGGRIVAPARIRIEGQVSDQVVFSADASPREMTHKGRSEKLISLASDCSRSSGISRASVKTASWLPANGTLVKRSAKT